VGDPAGSERTTVQTPGGPVVIRDKIHAKWLALKDVISPDGDDVQSHLELPLGEQVALPTSKGGGALQLFRRGMIVERSDGNTFVVYGAIYDRYLSIGGPAGPLGHPTSDEEASAFGGRVSHFRHGDIHWREDAGARVVRHRRFAGAATQVDPFAPSFLRAGRRWLARGASALRSIRHRLRTFPVP
jgi:hypothetical protein